MHQQKHYKRSELDAALWDAFTAANANNVVYFCSWYLDSVCADWEAIIIEQGGKWVAAMPIQVKRKYFIRYSLQPFFCKYLGAVIRKDIQENSEQKKILNAIIDAIPSSVKYFNYFFHPSFDYFIPFKWKGYTVAPQYSYKLDISQDRSSGYSTSISNHIKKSIRNNLRCVTTSDPDALLLIAKQRKVVDDTTAHLFDTLWRNLNEHKQGLLLHVADDAGNVHSAAAFAICGDHAYMILSVVNGMYKKQGGNALLINEAFKMLQKQGIKWFYFEGSMLENVEAYINGFRAEKVLYFNIYKSHLPLLNEVLLPMQQKIKAIL